MKASGTGEARSGASPEAAYWLDEWNALVQLAALMRSAPVELEATHCAWLASLDLDPFLAWALSRGAIDLETRSRLRAEPLRRNEVLATLAQPF